MPISAGLFIVIRYLFYSIGFGKEIGEESTWITSQDN
jgi:hypothetical protein